MNSLHATTSSNDVRRITVLDGRASAVEPGKHSTWFGSPSTPLLGTVHIPEGSSARGAVVLCPPVGKEHVDSYRGLALMAQKLCDAGLLVLRFDYQGMGDSAGEQDADHIVAQWTSSIVTAVEFVRSCGVEDVALVGLRVGALLAAEVAAQCGVLTGLALWDPVVSGRSYLREQRALYAVTVAHDSEVDSRISIVGAVLNPDVAAEFEPLNSSTLPTLGCPVLVATRDERGSAKPIRALVARQNADEYTLSDHETFLEPPGFDVIIPTENIAWIASWVDACFGERLSSVSVPVRLDAVVPTAGGAVTETLESLGSDGLFGIRTTTDRCVPGGPTLVLYGTANEHRVGPVRMWVETARALAVHGVTTLRFDRRGTGESGSVIDDEHTMVYSDHGDEDALSVIRSAGSPAENIVVSGLCSGAWYAGYAAHTTALNAAVLINVREWTTRRVEFTKRSSMQRSSATGVGAALDHLHEFGVRAKERARSRMPYFVWAWLGRRGLIQVPEISLKKLRDNGVRTTVLLSPHDTEWFVENRGPESMKRLRRRAARLDVPVVKAYTQGDHTLFGRDMRENVRTELVGAVATALKLDIDPPASPFVLDWTPQ